MSDGPKASAPGSRSASAATARPAAPSATPSEAPSAAPSVGQRPKSSAALSRASSVSLKTGAVGDGPLGHQTSARKFHGFTEYHSDPKNKTMSPEEAAIARKFEDALRRLGYLVVGKCGLLISTASDRVFTQCSHELNESGDVPVCVDRCTRHIGICNTRKHFETLFKAIGQEELFREIDAKDAPVMDMTKRSEVVEAPPPPVLRPRDGMALAEKGDIAEKRALERGLGRSELRERVSNLSAELESEVSAT